MFEEDTTQPEGTQPEAEARESERPAETRGAPEHEAAVTQEAVHPTVYPAAAERVEVAEPRAAARGGAPVRAVALAVAGWLVPGLGHALLKMWGRAVAIFLTVGCLVYLGSGMRGNLFAPGGEDAFSRLGYLADAGSGSFYFAARSMEAAGPDVSHADGDYGTRFLATAGVLNLLAALHAYEAARGRKA